MVTSADDGQRIRPFETVEEMDEHMVDRWNSVVGEFDTVIHLGDVVMNRRYLNLILPRLKGKKRLVAGNHDVFKLREYTDHFEDIRGAYPRLDKEFGYVLMTHIPVHPSSKGRFHANVHGHLHANNLDDSWYMNVSVEQIDYTPLEWSELISRLKERGLGKDAEPDTSDIPEVDEEFFEKAKLVRPKEKV